MTAAMPEDEIWLGAGFTWAIQNCSSWFARAWVDLVGSFFPLEAAKKRYPGRYPGKEAPNIVWNRRLYDLKVVLHRLQMDWLDAIPIAGKDDPTTIPCRVLSRSGLRFPNECWNKFREAAASLAGGTQYKKGNTFHIMSLLKERVQKNPDCVQEMESRMEDVYRWLPHFSGLSIYNPRTDKDRKHLKALLKKVAAEGHSVIHFYS